MTLSGSPEKFVSTAPGRVNLLGEHVDYNGGSVLPAAIDRSVRLESQRTDGRLVSIRATDLGDEVVFSLDSVDKKEDIHGQLLPNWALYPAGVAWSLQKHGFETVGFKGTYSSNVPIGAGLSSSAAVEVAFAAMWQRLGGWSVDGVKLAQMCQYAENRYVGVNSGLMDQFASANGVDKHVLYFNTHTLEWTPVPLPDDAVIVIADSTVRRSLFSSAYNERRKACEQAVELLRPSLPGIQYLCDVTPEQFEPLAGNMPDVIEKRARHVIEECERVRKAVEYLRDGDAEAFGRLMIAGHASLRDLYEVSIPELDALVETAVELPGCWGARLTGAGFGGCTVNLVQEQQAETFMAGLREGYRERTGLQAEVYLCRASSGVTVSELE